MYTALAKYQCVVLEFGACSRGVRCGRDGVCVHARAVLKSGADVDGHGHGNGLCVCLCAHERSGGEFGANGDGSQKEFRQVGGQRIMIEVFEDLRVPADAFGASQ